MKLGNLLAQLSSFRSEHSPNRRSRLSKYSRKYNSQALERLEDRILLSSVNGIVFEDSSGDGVKAMTDRQLSGFPVSAWNVGTDNLFGTADDQFIAATRTNAVGQYTFTLTTAANYAIRFGGQIGVWQFSTVSLNSQTASGDVNSSGVSAVFSSGGTAADATIDGGIQPIGSERVRARIVQQTYALAKTHPTYFLNFFGQNEKWLKGQYGGKSEWYFLTPTGDLYNWDSGVRQATGEYIASLGTAVYTNPALLHNALGNIETTGVGPQQLAYDLDTQLHLEAGGTKFGNWYETYGGQGVRWVAGDFNQHGNRWYFIRPDGAVHAWDGALQVASGAFLAQLGPEYFQTPTLFSNAVRPVSGGDVLGLTKEAFGITKTTPRPALVTTGSAVWYLGSTNQFGNKTYFLTSDGKLSAWNGKSSQTGAVVFQLPATVFSSPEALAVANPFIDDSSAEAAAYDLNRHFGLTAPGYYFDNWGGQNEKWIKGKTADNATIWLIILPTGEVRKADSWTRSPRSITSTHLANLSPVYYQFPRLLHNALKPVPLSATTPGTIRLSEGNPFAAEATVDIALGLATGTRTVSFDVSQFIDASDTGALLEDTLAVYLTEADNRSETILDRGAAGTTLLTLSGTHADFIPGIVRFNGTVVELDLTSIPQSQTGRLVFQLLNMDNDFGTQFEIRQLTNSVDVNGIQGPAVSNNQTVIEPGGLLDTTVLTVADQVDAELENVRYLPTDGSFESELLLHNEGDLLARTMVVTFPDLPSGVRLLNGSGTTPAGMSYINVTNAIPSGGLGRGQRSSRVHLEFDNPQGLRFPLRPMVLTSGVNHAPQWTANGVLTVLPGNTLQVSLNAVDPDGDNVTYSISASDNFPTTILRANGQLEIKPELDQIGSYTFDVIATDGTLSAHQTLTLNVVADPNTTTRISGVVRNTLDQPLAGVPVEIAGFSAVTATDGSFTITLPTMKVPTEAFNISIPDGDVFLDPFETGTQEIRFRRSRHDVTTGDNPLNPRMHPSLVTSFIDASTVYGSDDVRAAALRTFADGKLKISSGNLLPLNDAATFPGGILENDNEGRANPSTLFSAGDIRTNENVALIAMHTVFLREHNRLADEIKARNPSLTDEQIYQQARRTLGAILQHITYNEYLPLLIGSNTILSYTGYNSNVDPRESEIFASAAFRLGHTQLASEIKRLDAAGNSLSGGSLQLLQAFFTPTPIQNDGIEPFLRGLAATPMQEVDAHVIDDVRNFLFGPPGSGGMDLASMNIQRGRDVGLPSYNQARIDFGLPAVTTFAQITSDATTRTALQSVYGSVDKIDVWVGGIAEDHAAGAQVGPLFQAILKDQFQRTRDGDRFYFENGQFTSDELTNIRATTIESLIERNSSGVDLPAHPFTTGIQPNGQNPAGTAAGSTASAFRTIDGTGNNLNSPTLGASGGNVIRNFTNGYGDGISLPAGSDRPGAREISNAVVAQSTSIPSASGATSLFVFWGQILDHDLGLTPGGVSETLKILGNQRPNSSGNEAYPFVAERMNLLLDHAVYPGVNNVIARPIYLPVIDVQNGTTIDPTKDVMVTNANLPGAELMVTAGTLENRQGQDFTGVLSITEVPRELTPAALPSNLIPDLVVTIQPADMVFTTPAPISFPNRLAYPAGSMFDLWSIDPITGAFADVGDMKVSADGSSIETISGGIRTSSWHFPQPQPELQNLRDDTKPVECPCEDTGSFTSEVGLYSGTHLVTHELASYQSQGVNRGITLRYDSARANPMGTVQFSYDVVVGQVITGPPVANIQNLMAATFGIGSGDTVTSIGGDSDANGQNSAGMNFWSIDGITIGNRVGAGLVADLSNQPTGILSYELATGFIRKSDNSSSGTLTTLTGQLTNVNATQSPFGSGWGIAGLQQIVEANDGSVLLVDGDGGESLFRFSPSAGFQSPPSDFSTLQKLSNGTFRRTLTNGTVYEFNSQNRLIKMRDRNQNETRYEYDASGLLERMIDPVNQATVLTYFGGKIASIANPDGRTTRFTIDALGNLSQVEEPDGAIQSWNYDGKHLLVGETDPNGHSSSTDYDEFGRVIKGIRADGSELRFQAPTSQGVYSTTLTSDPDTAPNADVNFNKKPVAVMIQDNGNVETFTLTAGGRIESLKDPLGRQYQVRRDDQELITQFINARGESFVYDYDDAGRLIRTIDNVPNANEPSDIYGPGTRDGLTFPGRQFSVGDSPNSVVTEDLNGDGYLDVVIANASNSVSVLLGGGTGLFATAVNFVVGNSPSSLAIGDLNGDGRFDIVTANAISNDVSVLLGAGTGLFADAVSFAAGTNPASVAVGDLNSDGRLDIVTANLNGSNVSVLLGDGTGVFASVVNFPVGTYVTSVAIGDLNADGRLDLVAANYIDSNVSVLLGDGTGVFASAVNFVVGSGPFSVALGDLDADGRLDVVTANFDETVTVLLGNGNGTFTDAVNFVVATDVNANPRSVVIGDLDGDGRSDLVIGNSGSGNVSVLIGNGRGGFTTVAKRFLVARSPFSVALGDFDGDHILDLVTANRERDNISVLIGNGSGDFGTVVNYAVGANPRSVAIADMNSDGLLDLVTANTNMNTVSVLLADGAASFVIATNFAVGKNPTSVAVGDLNGDGRLDLVTANYGNGNVSILLGDGAGRLTVAVNFAVGTFPRSVVLGDLNSDGRLDIVTANNANVSVLLGDGMGGFAASMNFVAGTSPNYVALGDLNSDGRLDIVTGNDFSDSVSLQLGDGTGSFSAATNFVVGNNPGSVALGDINEDGRFDIVVTANVIFANNFNDSVSVLLGDGTGGFAVASHFMIPKLPNSVALNDMNGDGYLDVVTTDRSGDVSVLLGNGSGTFADSVNFTVANDTEGSSVSSMAIADLDGDGHLDVVSTTGDRFRGNVTLLLSSATISSGGGAIRESTSFDEIFGQSTQNVDGRGQVTDFDLDPTNGNVLAAHRPDGKSVQYTYTASGQIDTMIDANGHVTDYDYDTVERLIRITSAKGTPEAGVTRYEYDNTGNVQAVVDANNHRTDYEYDFLNRLKLVRDAEGHATHYEYDHAGNVLEKRDARGNVTTNVYDVRNRLIQTTDAQGHVTRFGYDRSGNLTSVTDPLGHMTRHRYDLRNRRIETIDPDGGVTQFRYDGDGNMISLTDPVGNRTLFFYDGRDRLIEERDPLGKKIKYGYDGADNLVIKTDREGRVTRYEYDSLNRLTKEIWVGDGNEITYTYDPMGNLLNVKDRSSELTYTYDVIDRVVSVDNAGTPNAPKVLLNYSYDTLGNVTSVTDTIDLDGPATAATPQPGATTGYIYDSLDRLTRLTQTAAPGANGSLPVSDKRVDFSYNPLGQYDHIRRYSDLGATQLVIDTAHTYDTLNRIKSIDHRNASGTDVSFFHYQYDTASRISQITDIDGVTNYSYDNRDQLTSANHSSPANPDESYTYDANGNRINSHLHGNGYVTGPGNRLLSDGTYNYTYDDEGNTTRRSEISTGNFREFTWDHRNRLIAVTDKLANGTPTQEVHFTYDSLDRRIAKSVDIMPTDAIDAVFTNFVYDREDVILDFVVPDGSGSTAATMTERYLHGPGIDQVFTQDNGQSSLLWLLTDHLETTREFVADGGLIVNHLNYDSFGNNQTTNLSRYQHTGREYDPELDMHYFRARYYSASIGRFDSQDPIGFTSGEENTFRYATNNPISNRDPWGLQTEDGHVVTADSGSVVVRESRTSRPFILKPGQSVVIREGSGGFVKTGERSGARMKFKDGFLVRLKELSSIDESAPDQNQPPGILDLDFWKNLKQGRKLNCPQVSVGVRG